MYNTYLFRNDYNYNSVNDMVELFILILNDILITQNNSKNLLSKVNNTISQIISPNIIIPTENLNTSNKEYHLSYIALYLTCGIHVYYLFLDY